MANRPKETEDKLNEVIKAWFELRKEKSFGKMTLEEFKAKVKDSFDRRDDIKKLDIAMATAINRRNDADEISLGLVQLVVNGVKGDADEGEDGDLIEAMGYVRKSERASGLNRSKQPPTPAPETPK